MDYIQILTLFSVISVGTERVVEIIKPLLPYIDTKYRTAIYSAISYVVSSILFTVNNVPIIGMHSNMFIQATIVGLACSAGSGFWNNIISAVKSIKTPE